jgi:hypothetical protein
MNAVIDNDVLLKAACYGLLDKLVWTASPQNGTGVLGTARFVVPRKIKNARLNNDRGKALQNLWTFLNQTEILEPGDDEQRMAADFELAAQKVGANLDEGESQLCAVVIQRVLPLLVTGDKRAITAFESILDADPRLPAICGKVKCMEQVFAASAGQHGCDMLRLAVCAEPEIDKALSICFACKSQRVEDASILEGLQSYIGHLRQCARRVLAP